MKITNCTNQMLQKGSTNAPIPFHLPLLYLLTPSSLPLPLTTSWLPSPSLTQLRIRIPLIPTPRPLPLGHLSRAICGNLGHQLLSERREFLPSSPWRCGREAPPGFFGGALRPADMRALLATLPLYCLFWFTSFHFKCGLRYTERLKIDDR